MASRRGSGYQELILRPRLQLHRSRSVDSSGKLIDGKSSRTSLHKGNLQQFRQPVQCSHQLTIYATRTPVRFSDRRESNQFSTPAPGNGYRVGDLLRGLVQSRIFLGQNSPPIKGAVKVKAPHILGLLQLSQDAPCFAASGVCLALPGTQVSTLMAGAAEPPIPKSQRQILVISNNIGVLPKPFFRRELARSMSCLPFVVVLADHRRFLPCSVASPHPRRYSGHSTDSALTSVKGMVKGRFVEIRFPSISMRPRSWNR